MCWPRKFGNGGGDVSESVEGRRWLAGARGCSRGSVKVAMGCLNADTGVCCCVGDAGCCEEVYICCLLHRRQITFSF